MRKICFFTENHYKGGVDTFIINLLNSWNEDSDNITLMCNISHPGLDNIKNTIKKPINFNLYKRFYTSKSAIGNSSCKLSKSIIVRIFYVITYRILQYPIIFPWYLFTLYKFFKKSNFDNLMVINGGYPASLLCRSAIISWKYAKKKKAILNIHSSAIKTKGAAIYFENFIDNLVIQAVDKIICVSKYSLTALNNRSAFIDFKNSTYIYNGILDPNTTGFILDPYQKKHNSYCLMLATYTKYKGHSFLLQCFKNVIKINPNVILKIYGYGKKHEFEHVVSEIKLNDLEKNVILGDFLDSTSELISKASILVVPSQLHESFGLVMIEAMAYGVPIVATSVGGLPEVLNNSGAGFIFDRQDVIGFSNGISEILNNDQLAKQMGIQGRKHYLSKYTSNIMASNYKKALYN